MARVDPRLIALLAMLGGPPEPRRREHEWRQVPGMAAMECIRCGKRLDLEDFDRVASSECRGREAPC